MAPDSPISNREDFADRLLPTESDAGAADVRTPAHAPAVLPRQIGRYRVIRQLGRGGFGVVYLAEDDQLHRHVAVKVPHRERIRRPADAEAYLAEARIVAALDHPNIVPVHDAGGTNEFPCFIVSSYIEGCTLAQRMSHGRFTVSEAVQLVATVAETLHHAHLRGLVHRDVKPANILLDGAGKPYVADFGLALKDENVGRGARIAGTPAYMSPEQARGEGHRVDGRSDLCSLGVVFYELLSGRRPFQADSQKELLAAVATQEPRPLRQIDATIPRELERICLKALAKRAADRYLTAQDMADDLRHCLLESRLQAESAKAGTPSGQEIADHRRHFVLESRLQAESATNPAKAGTPTEIPTPTSTTTPTAPASDDRPLRIVPKGLRSFDAHDADFFLELLPGPRDRDGLPDSLRFWKTRIEERDADSTFAVGLIYGPSGCGKSSLVKAGLLPRLSEDVIAVYVEATAEQTEARLLHVLRKRCPSLPASLGLKDTLAALRVGQAAVPVSGLKKLLIVLDQFEQWLHAKRNEENTELVQALRQCDGGRVQCVVMVRDDFWMATTRFMRDLEVRLVEGQNSAAVDLFPLRHAEKVLAAFGRAFGVLPDSGTDMGKDQQLFVEHALRGLAQESKVICVRLALFAEMMKGKLWTPATLKAVGGTEGVGATFLEETFSAATAPPEHRYHQKAARAVLKALLPETGTDIKGHMRSHAELLAASGYAGRPKEFDELLGILDGEIRLITPTDPEGVDELQTSEVSKTSEVLGRGRYYQLTHDYLVPSLRDWLTRKQKETRRGRAELLLADRAAVWNGRPENRQLPSLWQWANIRFWTRNKNWTVPQRDMMRKASRYHLTQALLVAILLMAGAWTGVAIWGRVEEDRNRTHAAGLVKGLVNAEMGQVPDLLNELDGYRAWADPLLREEYDSAPRQSAKKLHAALALLRKDPAYRDYVYRRLLDAAPQDLKLVRHELLGHAEALQAGLWQVVDHPPSDQPDRRLRAACALAAYDPSASARWQTAAAPVAEDMLAAALKNPSHYPTFLDLLQPVGAALVEPLAAIFRNPGRADTERMLATSLLAEFVAHEPEILADLLMDAEEKQFAVLYSRVKEHGSRCVAVLAAEIDKLTSAEMVAGDAGNERRAKRQANAAVALLKLKQPANVWRVLKHSPDPRARSYLIHRLAPLGADPTAIVKRLDKEPEVSIRRALILSLGEFGDKVLTPDDRKTLLPKLQDIYRRDADAGLHAAAEWLLRHWEEKTWLRAVNEKWQNDRGQQAERLAGIRKGLASRAPLALGDPPAPGAWYVNGQGQTMVVIPGPVEFLMGSPPTEAGRTDDEPQHQKRIGRSFAIAAKPVTVEQYGEFDAIHQLKLKPKFTRMADLPVVGTSWYQAAAYCNWLSKKEGILEDEWCYETGARRQVVKLKANYLSLAGYRLPTETEMEYATRAGALTSRFYGETEELLPKYAWYLSNSQEQTWPVAWLKPNDYGLFDVQGNVFTWCQEPYGAYPAHANGHAVDDKEYDLFINADKRVLRGGAFSIRASLIRSALRNSSSPTSDSNLYGFRVARTINP